MGFLELVGKACQGIAEFAGVYYDEAMEAYFLICLLMAKEKICLHWNQCLMVCWLCTRVQNRIVSGQPMKKQTIVAAGVAILQEIILKPKVLQRILGHATLSMTMDLYVSVTEEELQKEVAEVQKHLKVV